MLLKIGHRGACGYKPENTLSSFKKALELEVDMIEFDVQICGSGELVVLHDKTVDRTTNGRGEISKISLEELKSLKIKEEEKIPTLKETLDLINKRAKVNIELKGKNNEISKSVLKVIKHYIKEKGWSKEDFLISSFNIKYLKEFRRLDSKIKIATLYETVSKIQIEESKELGAHYINLYYRSITKDIVKEIHRQGLKILVWTVNNKEDIKKMIQLNVDGIISDYPDRIVMRT